MVRSTTLSAYEEYRHTNVYGGELSLLADGNTLQIQGSKEGIIPFELGSGSHYIATYPDFFTSTTEPSVVAY
ncbi:hypothetical protein ACN28S_65675 [Cystobacter fuscus]